MRYSVDRKTCRLLVVAFVSLAIGVVGRSVSSTAQPSTIVAQEVHHRLSRDGHARVLVELRLPGGDHVAEGLLANNAMNTQRRDIAAAGGQVLSRLARRAHRLIHRYETVPFVALDVGADAVAELEASTFWVKRVIADNVNMPTLPESVPLVGADAAWSRGFDGSGTVVAILDTGVQSTHPFLAGKVVEEACYSTTGATSSTLCPNGQDEQVGPGAGAACSLGACYHGTHVAGIAAGNGAGAGVAFSGVAKGAQIMPVQIFSQFNDSGSCGGSPPCVLAWDSDIIAGLERVYALRGIRNFASVNLSLGGAASTSNCDTQPHKPIIDNLRAAGIATVIAAGNAGATNAISVPGCISSAISVGATTKADDVASYSNVSSFMSLFAPGSSIYSSLTGGGFGYLSGTSMATPHVTGAWAVLKQGAPTATVSQVLTALQSTGVLVSDRRPGGTVTKPRIQIGQALSVLAPGAQQGVNVAAQTNGGVAWASSSYGGGYSASAVNDGDRKGVKAGAGDYWISAGPNGFPEWVKIAFNGKKTITEIDVFTVQDAYTAPVDPTPSMTFSAYGISDFQVMYWTGTTWATVPGGSITGNRQVWTRLSFPALTTDLIAVVVTRTADGWSRIVEVEAWSATPPAPLPPMTNVAARANGGVASASSAYSAGYPASALNDGDRKGVNAGAGGYWVSAGPNGFPQWVQVMFNGQKTITEIDVFTVQDAYTSPVEPTLGTTFSAYGIMDFQVMYWTGTAWATVPGGSITGNRQVWTRLTFPALTTDRILVVVTRTADAWSRIVEVEAWSPLRNVAAQANGGMASASSAYSAGYPASAVNDGDREGDNAGAGGYWASAGPNGFPEWVQVIFNGQRTITEIDVFTVQDAYTSPVEPTLSTTFSAYGIMDFQVMYWTGTAWATVPGGSITGNRQVWTRLSFPALTTDRILVVVTRTADAWSRIVELEAWGN